MRSKACAFALSLLASANLPALAADSIEEKCTLVRITSLDMSTDEGGGVYVPLLIGGQTVNLLIDTGGVLSTLTQSTVDALSLSASRLSPNLRIVMFGGVQITRFTTAHEISFGGLKAPTMDFLIMPDGHMPPPVNGLLAPDVLRAYDDEFDFASAKFSLFSRDHCSGNLAYWTQDPHAEIPFQIDPAGHIEFSVTLDGQQMRVALDTGAGRSVLGFEEAEDMFRFDEKNPSLETLSDTSFGHEYKYPFHSLVFGDASAGLGAVTVNNPDLVLISKSVSRVPGLPKLILGMGVLRQLHIYISYKEKKLYVTAATAH